MKTKKRMSMLGPVFVALASATVFVASSRAAESRRPDLAEIDKRVRALKAVAEDELTREQELRSAQRALQELLETTEQQVREVGGERNPFDPFVKLHTRIIVLRVAVEARLPHDDSTVGGTRRSLFPVPTYSDKKIVGKAANVLWDAQTKLADHLRKPPDDSRQAQELLVDMILAQEDLAWEVGWPFTAEEAASVKKASQVTEEVYLSRRNRGVERINEHLAKHHRSVGRQPADEGFVIHSPDSKAAQTAVQERLAKQRGEAAARVWTKGTQTFDEEQVRQPASAR